MSAASLKVLRAQITRGFATLATIDAWEAKGTVTPAEAEDARAYWHELNDPPPPPVEPTPPAAAEPAQEDAAPDTDGG